jgi:hypothetical protein
MSLPQFGGSGRTGDHPAALDHVAAVPPVENRVADLAGADGSTKATAELVFTDGTVVSHDGRRRQDVAVRTDRLILEMPCQSAL